MNETLEMSDLERLQLELQSHKQDHLLTFVHELSPKKKAHLIEQLSTINWPEIESLIDTYVRNKPNIEAPEPIEPAPYFAYEGESKRYAAAKERGESLLRESKIAAFTVAGGQGTRLGWDKPKGTFKATPVSKKSLFQLFAEQLVKTQQLYNSVVPWYIMTSETNHAATVRFFEDNRYFGLDKANVMLFPQGMVPSFNYKGKLMLAQKHSLAKNPDGHGGSLTALEKSGALDDMVRRNIKHISYFQVDNPNVRTLDPLFIGLHEQEGSEMSSKMLAKAAAKERVGNFVLAAGRVTVIEYSDIADALAEARNEDGTLKFNAGSIAIHIISLDFAQRFADHSGRGLELPFHRADKAVPHLDLVSGEHLSPQKPNAVKLERFIFDALPLAENSIILETDRVEEFAPIKNAEGTDSPQTSLALQTERAARWLERNGVEVARGEDGKVLAVIEISPLTALEPEHLKNVTLPERVGAGETLLL